MFWADQTGWGRSEALEHAHLRNAGDWGGLDVKAGQVGLPSDHGGFHRSD